MVTPDWQRSLSELVERLDVPGAVLGISHRGERVVAAAGIAGLANPAPVTPETAFQLGSISKVYTATLLLTLAGPEILDRSVAELVPEADWMDPAITVGHLLTHSSGLGGDQFTDTGRGDDALARYTARLRGVPADHQLAPGLRYSYCNSGYAVLGRLIEVLADQTYDDALTTHLLSTLGVRRTTTLPEDSILGPVALGHNRHDPEPLTADDQWTFARACNPFGGVTASAGDVLTFAERHLAGDHIAALMQERRLESPPLSRPSARGLGWAIFDWDGGTLIGHDGETLGQIASLRLLPAQQLAVVVLTNAIPDGGELASTLVAQALAPHGLTPPPRLAVPPPLSGFDPSPYLGRYRNRMATHTVAAVGTGLAVTTRYESEGLPRDRTVTDRLLPLGGGAFMDPAEASPTRALRFDDPDERGRMRSFFYGRLAWRVADEDE